MPKEKKIGKTNELNLQTKKTEIALVKQV